MLEGEKESVVVFVTNFVSLLFLLCVRSPPRDTIIICHVTDMETKPKSSEIRHDHMFYNTDMYIYHDTFWISDFYWWPLGSHKFSSRQKFRSGASL